MFWSWCLGGLDFGVSLVLEVSKGIKEVKRCMVGGS